MSRRARIHRRVEVDVWKSGDFRALSAPKPNAQTLWLWLLTSERTTIIPGVVVARPAVMADDLRWSLRGFNAALAELESAGMVEVDREAGLVLIVRALVVDGQVRDGATPSSVNAAKSWATTLLKLPPSPLRDVVSARVHVVISHCEDKIRSAFAETSGTASGRRDASRADAVGTQGTGNREQIDPESLSAPQPEAGRSVGVDTLMATAERLYQRQQAYLAKLAASIPRCSDVRVGGLAPAGTLTAIVAIVQRWHAEADAAGLDRDEHVEAQIARLVAVRTATARRVQHVRFWASRTFWDQDEIETDLLQSPAQASDRKAPGAPAHPRSSNHTAGAAVGGLLEHIAALEAAGTEAP